MARRRMEAVCATRPEGPETTACPVCCGHRTGFFREHCGYRYLRCVECGFVFLHPMPAKEVLEALYNEDAQISATHFPKAGSRRRKARFIALRFLPFLTGRDALDVGCGGGFMVDAFRFWGARAVGLDISAQSIAYARSTFPRSTFYCEPLERFLERDLTFDFVFSAEVIEHVTRLDAYVEFLRRVTRSGGRLYITTPDIAAATVPAEITDWDVFDPPRHVQFFCENNLRLLLHRHGFDFVRRYRNRKAGLKVLFRKR